MSIPELDLVQSKISFTNSASTISSKILLLINRKYRSLFSILKKLKNC